MDVVSQDFRIALRKLARSPFFAIFVVLTLGVGIAANTVMFSIAGGVVTEEDVRVVADGEETA